MKPRDTIPTAALAAAVVLIVLVLAIAEDYRDRCADQDATRTDQPTRTDPQ